MTDPIYPLIYFFLELEALYRYKESKYYAPPVTPPEQKTQKVRPSPTPSRRPGSSSSHASKSSGNLQLRAKSAPIHTSYRPPPKLQLPTPAQCWSTHIPETEITAPQPSPAPSVRSYASLPRASPQVPQWPTPVPDHVPLPTSPHMQPKEKAVRIQSAKYRRETPTKPQRPVKSAGPVRPSPTQIYQDFQSAYPQPPTTVHDVHIDTQFSDRQHYDTIMWPEPSAPLPSSDRVLLERPPSYRATPQRSSAPSPVTKTPSGKRTPLRPRAPSLNKMVAHVTEDDTREGGASTPDYDNEVKKHGWMLEVHGNPLNLK